MSNSFGLFNLEFDPPESMMRQPCGGRKPCDESDPAFKVGTESGAVIAKLCQTERFLDRTSKDNGLNIVRYR